MSTSETPDADYRMEYNAQTGYVTFGLGDEETVDETMAEYNEESNIYDGILDSILFNDPTPTVNSEEPSEVLVSRPKVEKFKQTVDEVLEE